MVRYDQIVQNILLVPNFLEYYERELIDAKKELGIRGSLEKQIQELPGITEHRFNQLQEIEAVLNFLNIELRKIKKEKFLQFLEKYNRALSSKDAMLYAEAEDEVIDMEIIVNEVALLRNKYLGIIKGIESKNFQLGHISRLRTAGLENVML